MEEMGSLRYITSTDQDHSKVHFDPKTTDMISTFRL